MNLLFAQSNEYAIKLTNGKIVSNIHLYVSFEIQNDSDRDIYLLLNPISGKRYVENEYFYIEFIDNINIAQIFPVDRITKFPQLTLITAKSRFIYTFVTEYFKNFSYNFNMVTDLKIIVLSFLKNIGEFKTFNEYIKMTNELGEKLEMVCPLIVIQ